MCRIAAPINTRMEAVTKADIMRQLIQLAVHGHLSSIAARVLAPFHYSTTLAG
jgi:hypothetical protein